MRLSLIITLSIILAVSGCSESDEPNVSIVETHDVARSNSSSRTFRGSLEHLMPTDTVVAYGFEWESRYGSWQAKKHGRLKKGKFVLNDTTRLSKWNSYTVRAFIETTKGFTYGNAVDFATEGE